MRFSRNGSNTQVGCDCFVNPKFPAHSTKTDEPFSISISRLLAISTKCSWFSRVRSDLKSGKERWRGAKIKNRKNSITLFVRDAEHSQLRLGRVNPFGQHHEFRQVRHQHRFLVDFFADRYRIGVRQTVDQPESVRRTILAHNNTKKRKGSLTWPIRWTWTTRGPREIAGASVLLCLAKAQDRCRLSN